MSNPAKQNKQRLSVELPLEMHQRLIIRAQQDGRPLVDVAAAMLEEALRQLEGWHGIKAAAVQTPAADPLAAADH